MKNLLPLFATLLAFSTAFAAETSIRIGNHDVNVITDQSPDSPRACHAALLEKIKKQGWHDEIYNSAPLPEVRLGRSRALHQNSRTPRR